MILGVRYYVLLVCLVSGGLCHLCLLHPPQRGSLQGYNTAGATDCLLTSGPCGGRQPRPNIVVKAGSNQTIVFQKNLDHYNKATPGYFSVSFGPAQVALKEVMRVPDRGDPSLSLYVVNVTIPAKAKTGRLCNWCGGIASLSQNTGILRYLGHAVNSMCGVFCSRDPFHTMQVVYVTNNTAAPPMFYQCTDMQIN